MSKTLLLIYFSLSFIALGSIVFLLFVARGRYYSRNSFGMNGDPQHIYVSEIVSGLTPLIIRKSVSYNKILTTSPSADAPTGFRSINDIWYSQYGFAWLQLSRKDAVLGVGIVEQRPFRTVASYRTTFGDDAFVVLIQEWLSINREKVYVPLVISEKFLENNTSLPDGTMNSEKPPIFLAPIVKIRDHESCLAIPTATVGYCNWFVKNMSKINKLTDAWVRSAEVPKQLERYPLLLVFSSFKDE